MNDTGWLYAEHVRRDAGPVGIVSVSVPWTKPAELGYDANAPLPDLGARATNSHFPVAFFDGHVQVLPKSLAVQNLRVLITRAAGDDTGGVE